MFSFYINIFGFSAGASGLRLAMYSKHAKNRQMDLKAVVGRRRRERVESLSHA